MIKNNFIPTSVHLDLLNFSEQRLTKFTSRILVTMKRNNLNLQEHEPYSISSQADACQNSQECDKQEVKNNHALNDNKKNLLHNLNQFRDKYFSSPRK